MKCFDGKAFREIDAPTPKGKMFGIEEVKAAAIEMQRDITHLLNKIALYEKEDYLFEIEEKLKAALKSYKVI